MVSMTKTVVALSLVLQFACTAVAQEKPPLRLVTKIPVPRMTGTWDHLTGDATGKRMFISAQEDQVVRVFDLKTNQPIHSITADFNRPQGLYYIPAGELFVTNGR